MDHEKSCADLKEMLSSFCPTGVKSDLSFECTKEDSNEPCDVPVKEATPSQLRNKEAYFRRVKTFSYMRWFAKPTWMSPLNCARYGWENVDIDMLQCVGCKAFLSGKLPSSFDPHVWSECMKKLQESVWDSHRPFCAWASNPCPEQFMRLPFTTRYVALGDFKQRVKGLLRLGDRLPQLEQTSLDSMDVSAGQLDKLRALTSGEDGEDLEEESTQTTACILALTGWTSWGEDKLNCVGCRYCNRDAGLWNFKSKHNQTYEPESPYSDRAEQDTSDSSNLHRSPAPDNANTEQKDIINHVSSAPHLNDENVNHEHESGSLHGPTTSSQEEPHDSPDQSTRINEFSEIMDADNIQSDPSLSVEPAARDQMEVMTSAAEELDREPASPSRSTRSSESSPSPVEVIVQEISDVSEQSSTHCKCSESSSDETSEGNIQCESEEERAGGESPTEELEHGEASQSGSSESSERSGSQVEELTEDTRQSSEIMESEESVQSQSHSIPEVEHQTETAESSRENVAHEEAGSNGSSQGQETDLNFLRNMLHSTPDSPDQCSGPSEPDHQPTVNVESVPKDEETRSSQSTGSSSPVEVLIEETSETSDQAHRQSKCSDDDQTTTSTCAESAEHSETGSAVHTDGRSISPMDVDCSSDVVAEAVTVTVTGHQDSNQQQHTDAESRQERSIFSASFDDSCHASGGKQSFSEGMVFGSFRELANKQRALDKTASENCVESLPNPVARQTFTEVRSPAVESDEDSSSDSSDSPREHRTEIERPSRDAVDGGSLASRDTVDGESLASPKRESENDKVDDANEEMEHSKQADDELMTQRENKDSLAGVDSQGTRSGEIEKETVNSEDCVKSCENVAVDSSSLERTSSQDHMVVSESAKQVVSECESAKQVVSESDTATQSEDDTEKPGSKRQLPDEGECSAVVTEPTPKRRRLAAPTRVDFDPLGEHRLWCPWVIQDQPIDRDITVQDTAVSGNQSDNSLDKNAGWKQFLLLLVSDTSGDVSFTTGPNDLTTSPIRSLISARKLLKDAKSPRSRLSF